MTDIDPKKRTYTHTITGPNARFLNEQVAQYIKDMESNPNTVYTIISVQPAIVISYNQEDADAD